MLHKISEERDSFSDQGDQLMHRWNQRLTLKNLSLAKRYLKGELRIHVHGTFSRGLHNSEDFCAVFEREIPPCGHKGDFTEPTKTGESFLNTRDDASNRDVFDDAPYQYRSSVFLCHAQGVEF